jgi:hypothetical protein
MKLESAKGKLEEALFFLNHLKTAAQAPKPFQFYLSAFLNAAYGVQTYLRGEVTRALREQARTQGKRLGKDEPRQFCDEQEEQWLSGLLPEKQMLWKSMKQYRGDEVHKKRVPTVSKEKAVPVPRSWAFAPHFMMLQHMAESYSEMVEKEGLSLGTVAWEYVEEHHHVEIEQSVVRACTDYVDLLANLITHFKQWVP